MDPQNCPIQLLEHKRGWISSSSSPVSSLHEMLDPAVTGAHRARALPTETIPPRCISGAPPAADITRRRAATSSPTVEGLLMPHGISDGCCALSLDTCNKHELVTQQQRAAGMHRNYFILL
ncbi:hypothetical protein PAHAL_4G056600 [Panicum hallii]|uniref:Uncharacterized protein n=1 Tax=Panicum hallii TaxID=206008 RepID=A0A2S3HHC6_9POAL|nr:hypothetical protein PAHAL_4G056600 [Panicum hallii]